MKLNLKAIARSMGMALQKHSPEILTGIGIAGMVTTTILAVRATPKALLLIQEAEEVKHQNTDASALTPVETIKAAWLCYVPAAVTGVLSMTCLIGASSVNLRRNAALATAYTLSESALKEYREKVVETIGEKKEQAVQDAVAKERISKSPVTNQEVIITEKGNTLCYVAKFKDGKHAGEWTATGTQFQVPYVFKKLFSKEPIEFKDMCETKSVASALYLDMNENLPDVSEQEKDLERIVKKAREFGVDMDTSGHSGDSELDSMVGEISKGHNYIFIGKVGQFCPIKPGCGGGLLMRETENKKTGEKGYAAAASSKGYRWLESEMVRELGKEESIDLSYYDNMVTEAVKTISQYGDFEWFVSDDPYVPDTPPWQEPSEPWNDRTPYDVR